MRAKHWRTYKNDVDCQTKTKQYNQEESVIAWWLRNIIINIMYLIIYDYISKILTTILSNGFDVVNDFWGIFRH